MRIEEFIKLKPKELADISGIHKSSWSRWINSEYDPSDSTLIKLSAQFDMTVPQILQGIRTLRKIRNVKKQHNQVSNTG